MGLSLTFLGAADTVTGSKYLVETPSGRILVDCGLFQGFKRLRLRNWAPFPVDPRSIDAVVLTHAHIDHSGYLPLLVRNGFAGPVLCTPATRDLCGVLLPDSAFLQEKDAEFANRYGFSKHRPALPLYGRADADAALARFRTVEFDRPHRLPAGLSVRFLPAGHILGAAIVELVHDGGRKLVFSGDLGRRNSPLMPDPTPVRAADHLLVESTYGDRRHDPRDPEEVLAAIITRTAGRGGTVLIPAFAVGRTQALLYHLQRIKAAGRIPDLPIVIDSPMAIEAGALLSRHVGAHNLTEEQARAGFGARYARAVEESKALDADPMPKVVISASGMATGGRVLHHLKRMAPDPRNTILFAGFQAGGTRGAAMVDGADRIKIHGDHVPVRAEVDNLSMLSAHADADEIMDWLRGFERPPSMTFIVHGEPAASDALRLRIEEELGWPCRVPEHGETVALSDDPGSPDRR